MIEYEVAIARVDANEPLSPSEITYLLTSGDSYLRWAGIKACGIQGLSDRIVQILNAVSAPVAGLAVDDLTSIASWTIAKFPIDAAIETASFASKSVDFSLRILAADLYGLIDREDFLEPLQRLLIDKIPAVSIWAALSLSKKGDAAVSILVKELNTENSMELVGVCVDALIKIHTPAAVAALDSFFARPDSETFKTLLT